MDKTGKEVSLLKFAFLHQTLCLTKITGMHNMKLAMDSESTIMSQNGWDLR